MTTDCQQCHTERSMVHIVPKSQISIRAPQTFMSETTVLKNEKQAPDRVRGLTFQLEETLIKSSVSDLSMQLEPGIQTRPQASSTQMAEVEGEKSLRRWVDRNGCSKIADTQLQNYPCRRCPWNLRGALLC